MSKSDRVFVAGHRGLIGSAIVEQLKQRGYPNILMRTRADLDLLDLVAVQSFFQTERPDVVILAAARVGGIVANNTMRVEFLAENLQVQNNVILAAHSANCRMLVFLGSSCVYPRECPQPIKEEFLLTGPLEYTNRPYALAKIAGLELINALNEQYGRRYFSVMPTNLYGAGDNFHPENSHVLPGLIRRFHQAKMSNQSVVKVWGTGSPRREFMYSTDCADAIVHLAEHLTEEFFQRRARKPEHYYHINVGSGEEVSISELAKMIADVVGFKGSIEFDSAKPDGTPRKLLDVSELSSIQWRPKTSLLDGIRQTYQWFVSNIA
jgi:GDP-L-fucose synthase